MLSCSTTKSFHYELPPEPKREEIKTPTNLKECSKVISYYEHLVSEWELWCSSVKKIIEN